MRSKIRVCSRCEWIFRTEGGCPLCGSSAAYAAHGAYGRKAYTLAKTQDQWVRRKLERVEYRLREFVEKMSKQNKTSKPPKECEWEFAFERKMEWKKR